MDENEVIVKNLRETRYCNGLSCPRCGGIAVKRNGTYRPKNSPGKRQRYLCNDCHKTFGELAFSPLAGTHYPGKWTEYFGCMVQNMSLRKSAKLLDISLSTAFIWRHKILTALQQSPLPALTGGVEQGKSEIQPSEEDSKSAKGIKARNDGDEAPKQGVNRQQCLKQWTRQFHGVSRKYFDHYLFWFLFVDFKHSIPLNDLKLAFMRESFKTPVKLKACQFRPCLNVTG